MKAVQRLLRQLGHQVTERIWRLGFASRFLLMTVLDTALGGQLTVFELGN